MRPLAKSVVVVKDYAGLVTNTGPVGESPAKGEAVELVNLVPLRPGELSVRPGYRVVQFDAED